MKLSKWIIEETDEEGNSWAWRGCCRWEKISRKERINRKLWWTMIDWQKDPTELNSLYRTNAIFARNTAIVKR